MSSLRLSALALLLGLSCAAPARQSPAPTASDLPGSLDGARVAIALEARGKDLLFLARDLDEEELQRLNAAAPNVRVRSVRSAAEALELAPQVHGADARFAGEEFLEAATQLRWVQAMSAGVERYLANEALTRNEDLLLTNMAGVHGPAIADHAFAMLLALTRDLRGVLDSARGPSWQVEEGPLEPSALEGRTLFVVGLGGIGNEIARRGHGFGMHVLATRRTVSERPAWVHELGTSEAFDLFLPRADVIAVCLPLTDETEGLFDAAAFVRVKPGAILINVARGRLVRTGALLEALQSGRLAGACLDVTDPEPLPPDHPLWSLPQVVITPHSAGRAALTSERSEALLLENLRRFGAGEPLLNVVDKRAGY
jgi:phosphoglycerate dehydrogenase-like enzyme